MSDRKVEFIISAKDEFTATFGKAEKDIQRLRRELSFPAAGPLTRDQSTIEQEYINSARAIGRANNRGANDIFRFGAAPKVDDLGLSGGYGSDITRLRGGLAPQTRADAEAAKQTVRLSEQAERFGKVLRLFGGATIADQVGRGLQKIPEVADKFATDIQSGATRTQAFASALAETLPGIGSLSLGIRNAKDAIDDAISGRGAERRKREEQQDLRDQRENLRDRNQARSQAILIGGRDAAREAGFLNMTAGMRPGSQRQLTEIDAEFGRAQYDINQKRAEAMKLANPDQQADVRRQYDELLSAKLKEALDKGDEVIRQAQTKAEAERREHVDKLTAIDTAGQNAELERDGKFYTLKLKGIEDNARDEQIAAKRKYEDALKDPDQDPKVAEERLNKELASIRRKAGQEKDKDATQENREIRDTKRDHDQSLLQSEADVASRRLKLAGKSMDAEKLAIRSGYESRLAEIAKNEEEQIRQHAERKDEIIKQAKADAAAALDSTRTSYDELAFQKFQEFRAPLPGSIGGNAGVLTGTIGPSSNEALSQLLSTNERTARAAEAQQKATVDLSKQIADLITAIQSGTGIGPP